MFQKLLKYTSCHNKNPEGGQENQGLMDRIGRNLRFRLNPSNYLGPTLHPLKHTQSSFKNLSVSILYSILQFHYLQSCFDGSIICESYSNLIGNFISYCFPCSFIFTVQHLGNYPLLLSKHTLYIEYYLSE